MAEPFNRTLARGMELLELLAKSAQGLELSQIARILNLPKSSAYNLLQTLVRLEYVVYSRENARYTLGLRMFEVGSSAVNRIDIGMLIRRYMNEINAQINETMHLGQLAGADVLYIDKIESTRSIRMSSHVGVRMPLYCTAMGKAILAELPDTELERLYPHEVLKPYAAHTVPTRTALRHQLERVRTTGYALECEENNDNVGCVGVAIRDRENRPAYALSVSTPMFRFDEEQQRAYGALLLQAREGIERALRIK